MFDFMKNEVHYSIGKLLDSNVINNKKKIIFFGYNHQVKLSISYLLGGEIKKDKIHIVDNNPHGEYLGIEVQDPIQVLVPYDAEAVILVATAHNKEIIKQAAKWGYKKNIQVYETLNKKLKRYRYGSWLRLHYPQNYNKFLNGMGYVFYKKNHQDICKMTESNIQYKNAYKGKRCFIMGNGPSVKEINLELLKDEYVFGVNQVMGMPNWEKANINFWVCIDGDFLGLWTNADLRFFDEMKKLPQNVQAFVPVEAKRNMEKHGIQKNIHINYVNFKLQYINLDQFVQMQDIDMCKFIIQPYNVVIACINIAIYMGFSEIYLLGCNQTVLLNELSNYIYENEKNMEEMHCITQNDISESITLKRMKDKGIYFEIKTQLVQLTQFKIMADYCKRNHIILKNISNPTLIESIDKIDLEQVMEK